MLQLPPMFHAFWVVTPKNTSKASLGEFAFEENRNFTRNKC
jgi:hypothetical protein